jgi:hypothetical protein
VPKDLLVILHSGKWVIEEYPGMFDSYSGITNNLSESMNAVLKRENDWKELPVNLLALGFNTFKTLRTMKFYVVGRISTRLPNTIKTTV